MKAFKKEGDMMRKRQHEWEIEMTQLKIHYLSGSAQFTTIWEKKIIARDIEIENENWG